MSRRPSTPPHCPAQAGEQGLRAMAGQAGPSPTWRRPVVTSGPRTVTGGWPGMAVETGMGRGQAGMSSQPGGSRSARPGIGSHPGLSRKVVPEAVGAPRGASHNPPTVHGP